MVPSFLLVAETAIPRIWKVSGKLRSVLEAFGLGLAAEPFAIVCLNAPRKFTRGWIGAAMV